MLDNAESVLSAVRLTLNESVTCHHFLSLAQEEDICVCNAICKVAFLVSNGFKIVDVLGLFFLFFFPFVLGADGACSSLRHQSHTVTVSGDGALCNSGGDHRTCPASVILLDKCHVTLIT